MATDPHTLPPRFRCSLRIATLVVCCFNIVAAIYLLQSFIGPLFSSPSSAPFSAGVSVRNTHSSSTAAPYTPEQLDRIKEAISIWRAAEPVDLINRVKEIQEESAGVYGLKETRSEKKPGAMGLVERLKEIRDSKSKTDQEALEEWRRKKLEEAKRRSEAMKAKQDEYLS
ncbi:hypothetical protein GOP47_0019569 [Adiantum capillus-veneris]|uniref:Transmembrane protein n=1 Tax=Adiantum capillus-veneris TaxID=13818 RepID=A0A9D4UCT3_ADICA|nr:hypothetical protein GOP47_0019569 [Adiantum capillus-veneris]